MKTKNIKEKIKEYFLLNPTKKLRVRQIEKEVKVPLPSAIRYSKELEKEGVLKKIDIAGMKVYVADRASERYVLEKKLFNLKQIYNSGLVRYLKQAYSNPTIILFGSCAKGEDVEESDIDLYIETPLKRIEGVDLFEKKLQRKLQIFIYPSIERVKNKELANNIINGIILNGFLEVLK